jgi:hypothetical protein
MPGLWAKLRGLQPAARLCISPQVSGMRKEKCRAPAVGILWCNQQRELRGFFFWIRLSLSIPEPEAPGLLSQQRWVAACEGDSNPVRIHDTVAKADHRMFWLVCMASPPFRTRHHFISLSLDPAMCRTIVGRRRPRSWLRRRPHQQPHTRWSYGR